MKTIIITAGETFADIDVLACAIAYSNLLTLEGKPNEVVLPGVLNSSITETIKGWDLKYVAKPKNIDSPVVLVDISEFAHVSKFVKLENVIEVYDHRFGFGDFWKEKLGSNAHVELVGSCATLIWEEYKKRDYDSKISPLSANLLTISILSNTLNFGASVTTQRDIDAFNELKEYTDLPDLWQQRYFLEVEANIYSTIEQAIVSDTKVLDLPAVGFPIVMAQLELWDASKLFDLRGERIKSALEKLGHSNWFLSVPSISEKKNYIYTQNQKIKDLLSKIMPITFDGDFGITDKLWLRKEIRKKLLELK